MSESQTHRIAIESGRASFEELCDLLEHSGLDDFTTWEPEDADVSVAAFFRQGADSAESLLAHLNGILVQTSDCDVSVSLEAMEREDWETAWREFFHAARVSERVVVRPSWESWGGEEGLIEIVIDPGMSFGTGLHATTRACIGFLDRIANEDYTFLDAGCGSGILSIAAAKMGISAVRAFDIDREAVDCTLRNLASNGVSADVVCADLQTMVSDDSYDVVAVNILAPVIAASVAQIRDSVAQGGHLLLAGLNASQYTAISSRFIAEGFAVMETVEEGEWVSGLLKRH